MFRYALGHLETAGEDPIIVDLNGKFTAGGYRFKSLLLETAASAAFRQVGKLD